MKHYDEYMESKEKSILPNTNNNMIAPSSPVIVAHPAFENNANMYETYYYQHAIQQQQAMYQNKNNMYDQNNIVTGSPVPVDEKSAFTPAQQFTPAHNPN